MEGSAENLAALEQLADMLEQNLAETAGFHECWISAFPGLWPRELMEHDFHGFFCVALPKWLVEHSAQLGWDVESRGRYLYRRRRPGYEYTMMSEVLTLTRLPGPETGVLFHQNVGLPSQMRRSHTADRVLEVAWRDITWADEEIKSPGLAAEVAAHLAKVIAYREARASEQGGAIRS